MGISTKKLKGFARIVLKKKKELEMKAWSNSKCYSVCLMIEWLISNNLLGH